MAAKRTKKKFAEEVPPHAARMTKSLTGLGYDFDRAVADVIDNSITYEAENIWIEIRSGEDDAGLGEPYVSITDDGIGMSLDQLVDGMRYGSQSSVDDRSLSKFGLGLKTASTSQCNRLTVASRPSSRGPFHARAWDLPYLEAHAEGRWMLLEESIDSFPIDVKTHMRGASGTAVLWTDLSRILPHGAARSPRLLNETMNDLAESCRSHLSMVFNRFISGSTAVSRRKVIIEVNGKVLAPWDPLLSAHPNTKRKPSKTFTLREPDGSKVIFTMHPAILPRKEQFVDEKGGHDRTAHKLAGGPNGWNAAQGFYVYRLDRLIQDGGWSSLRALDEHSKTARVEVDLDRSADEAFRLNVAKTRVLFPAEIKDELKDYTAGIVSDAKKSYGAKHGSKGGARKRSTSRGTAGTSTDGAKALKSPTKSTKSVLNRLYGSCKNGRERKSLLEIMRREYPGFNA